MCMYLHHSFCYLARGSPWLVVRQPRALVAVWADMEALGIDALITAPQKGWTGPACAGLVMLGKRGAEVSAFLTF